MFIVEGADLTGKSSLCQRLASHSWFQKSGYVHRHLSRLPSGFDRGMDYCEIASRKVIQDRFHMSEPAYCHARGELECPLTPERYRFVDGYLRSLGSFTVILTADPELVRYRYESLKRMEMYDLTRILKANEAFCRVVEGIRLYNIKNPDFDCSVRFTLENQYLADDDVEKMIKQYCHRQDALWGILHKRG